MPDSGVALQIGSLTIRWYGILICSGMALAFLWAYKMTKQRGFSVDDLINLFLWAIPCGIIGARLYYVIFQWPYYAEHLSDIFRTWKGGMAIHGGVIAGVLVVFLYSRYKKQSFRQWGDILSPGVILAQGIGRWGNFFNQEAYGYVTDVPWAMYIDGAYRHPTFLYESIWDIAGFAILAVLCWKGKGKKGDILAGYFIWYSVGRFFIEQLRTDSLMLGPLRVAVLVSAVGVLLGLVLLWYNRKHPAREVPPETGAVRPIKKKKE